MKPLNKLDKVAYWMLTPMNIVALLLAFGVIGMLIYGGMGVAPDSESNVWASAIILIVGIVLVPVALIWIVQFILNMIGLANGKKRPNVARGMGLASAIIAFLLNCVMCGISIFGVLPEEIKYFDLYNPVMQNVVAGIIPFAFDICCVLYTLAIGILFIVSLARESKKKGMAS